MINILFYDDGIVGSRTFETCCEHSKFVFNSLMFAHILPNAEKSHWNPSTTATWLGYTWDYERGGVSVSERRVKTLFSRIQYLRDRLPKVSARQVAQVVGSLVSMILVFDQRVMLHSRFMQSFINFG